MVNPARFIVDFESIDHDDGHIVGDHAARLGSLKKTKFLLPQGFIITPAAYFEFVTHNSLDTKIGHLLGSANFDNENSISQVSRNIKKLINSSEVPQTLVKEIFAEYEKLGGSDVKIHTSIVSGEHSQNDFPREYHLDNIAGESALIDLLRSAWASIFDHDLIVFRNQNNIDHLKTGISAVVSQVPVPVALGRIHTRDTDFRDKSKLIIETEGGKFAIDKSTRQVQKRSHGLAPTVFVKDGSILSAQSLDPDLIDYAMEIAASLEGSSIEGHEISWVRDNANFYILNVKPLNFYG